MFKRILYLITIFIVFSLFSSIDVMSQPCPNLNPFCDSTSGTEDCLYACPGGDEIFVVIVKDSCGNFICAPNDVWFDFSNCPTVTPCAGHHPEWPLVRPDSCDAVTGQHYFTIRASIASCTTCDVEGVLNGVVCEVLPLRAYDTDGSGTVDQSDFHGGTVCADYNCDMASDSNDSLIHMAHIDHSCSGIPADTCCDYLIPSFADYAPMGMPDFDQKQNQPAWSDGINPTHCGPLAVANSLWWIDAMVDSFDIAPPTISDGFPLVTAYGAWDDHDLQNVEPLVNNLATLMQTNNLIKGTLLDSLISGTRQYIAAAGYSSFITDTVAQYPSYDFIKNQVLLDNNVILLLGFYERDEDCCRIGGHFVTVAGACTSTPQICISDPWYDAAEGEPPAGIAHGAIEHNDAGNISGPHGQNKHDVYSVFPKPPDCIDDTALVINWPFNTAERTNFNSQNQISEGSSCNPNGTITTVVIEYAFVINKPDTLALAINDPISTELPTQFKLQQNYPNPFNPSSEIVYSIPYRSHVTLTVYNALGQVVKILVNRIEPVGTYSVIWDGKDKTGEKVSSGIYLYRLDTEDFSISKKMILIK